MKVIDNKKDYYDYIVGTMGIDEKVVYDRRGSTIVGESDFYMFDYPHDYDLYFSKKPFKSDRKKIKKTMWQSCRYENRMRRRSWNWKKNDDSYEGMIYHLYLEVGYVSYIFEVERYLDDDDVLHIDVSIANTKRLEKKDKESTAPLYIAPYNHHITGKDEVNSDSIDNPILKNTWIPRFISAQDMWNMLYEYISSLNDKEFTDSRTNEQHIESHGFDKKISFRHRK